MYNSYPSHLNPFTHSKTYFFMNLKWVLSSFECRFAHNCGLMLPQQCHTWPSVDKTSNALLGVSHFHLISNLSVQGTAQNLKRVFPKVSEDIFIQKMVCGWSMVVMVWSWGHISSQFTTDWMEYLVSHSKTVKTTEMMSAHLSKRNTTVYTKLR